jgi:hypothetical protein
MPKLANRSEPKKGQRKLALKGDESLSYLLRLSGMRMP